MSRSINITPSTTIPLPVFNDDLVEGSETLWLILENPVGIYNNDPILQEKRYQITIIDNDAATVSGGGGGGGALNPALLLMLFGLMLLLRRRLCS